MNNNDNGYRGRQTGRTTAGSQNTGRPPVSNHMPQTRNTNTASGNPGYARQNDKTVNHHSQPHTGAGERSRQASHIQQTPARERSKGIPSEIRRKGSNERKPERQDSVKKKKISAQRKVKAKKSRAMTESGSERETGNTALTSLIKAMIYIMSVLVVSGFLSYFIITVGNDVFAFIKSDEQITVKIEDDTDIKDLGKLLKENGVIKYPNVFDFYAKIRKKNPDFAAGEYTVSPSMNYDQLIASFVGHKKSEHTTVVVTIPEGKTVDEIIEILVKKYGLSSESELKEAIQNYDFDYWFVKEIDSAHLRYGRKYRLEGYLYPDTYYYYSDASATSIIYKMLDNFDKKVRDIFRDDKNVPSDTYIEKIKYICGKYKLTFDDMVVLASMIQMESKFSIEYGEISSVFHNRLANPSKTDGKLESDATLQYMLAERVENLTEEHKKIDNPYNSYMYPGLPPGPISNPAQTAIIYALYPSNTKYYYFVAGNDGYSLFAETYKQHQENKKKVNEGK